MPKVYVDGKLFLAHWPKAGDRIIRAAAKKYKQGKTIRWQRAEAEGAFKGVLNVPLKKIMKRYRFLKNKRKIYAKRRRVGQPIVDSSEYMKRRLAIAGDAGYKSNRIEWLLKDIILLLRLVEGYKVNGRIKWKLLEKDKRIKDFPVRTARSLAGVYHRVMHEDAHRKNALSWKRKNRDRFNKTVGKRWKKKRKLIREFLWDKIGVRKS